jgi:hypothetical protein
MFPPGDRPDQALTSESPKAGRADLQFPTLAEAEAWLQSQGFRFVPGTCNWTNAAGDDAGCYSIDGEVKGWRVEISRRSPKRVKGLSRRLMLAGLATVGIPTSVRVAAAECDLIYDLIEKHRQARRAMSAAVKAECDYRKTASRPT